MNDGTPNTIPGFVRQRLWRLVNTVRNLNKDNGLGIAAEVSFYLLFSIFPLLFLLLTGINQLDPLWFEDLSRGVPSYVPELSRGLISGSVENMMSKYEEWHVLVASLLFLWPASSAFHAYADAVSAVYGFPVQRSYFKSRGIALFLLLGSGVIAFLTSAGFGLLPFLVRSISPTPLRGVSRMLVQAIRYGGSFLLITPSVALIYRFGPDRPNVESLVIWPGAVFATVLWILVSQLFGLYLTYLDTYRALYGSLGGAMLLLLWMYLTSLAVMLGAEYNYTCQQE